MSDNKLVKSLLDAFVLTGIVAGMGWATKKILKMSFTADPSNSFENFGKFSLVLAGSIATKKYLEDQKILPDSV